MGYWKEVDMARGELDYCENSGRYKDHSGRYVKDPADYHWTHYKPAIASNDHSDQDDAQLKELYKLLKLHEGTSNEAEIQSYIDRRLDKIRQDKK
jgi:hypothetical protein